MATSQNGYIANDRDHIETFTIPGTTRKVALRNGSPGGLLVSFAAWFDKNIESVDGGILDDWGYAVRPIRGGQTLSNHASGTALDLNAPRHPLGARNTFTDAQERKIRAELKRYEGTIRWGGDYKNRADEMHFEIVTNEATCTRVLAKIRKEDAMPKLNTVQKWRAAVEKAGKDHPIPADRTEAKRMQDDVKARLKEGPKS